MAANRDAPRLRQSPITTCISCRGTQVKGGLVRIVRTPAGRIEVDLTGKKAGRGAYLCKKRSCWGKAVKKDRLEHALKSKVSLEDKVPLEEFMKTLPAENEGVTSSVPGEK